MEPLLTKLLRQLDGLSCFADLATADLWSRRHVLEANLRRHVQLKRFIRNWLLLWIALSAPAYAVSEVPGAQPEFLLLVSLSTLASVGLLFHLALFLGLKLICRRSALR